MSRSEEIERLNIDTELKIAETKRLIAQTERLNRITSWILLGTCVLMLVSVVL